MQSLESTNLLGLPLELLTLIARHLGPRIRSSVGYLLVSRQWYRAALPAFLSCLSLSTIYLSSYNLLRWPPAHTPLSDLIAEHVERLSIRLVGHPSRQLAMKPWNKREESDEGDSDDEPPADPAGWDHWMNVGPVAADSLEGGKKSYVWQTEEHQLLLWRDSVNEKLEVLASVLPHFKNLEELSFEASSEADGALGPRWDYLFGSTVEKFVQAAPPGLKSLTLDYCGSSVVRSKQNRTPVHLCSLIACRLQDFERVRLRMRHICPQVFNNSNDSFDKPSKLESLVIRLTLPDFPEASYEKHDGYHEYDVQKCPSLIEKLSPLHVPFNSKGTNFAKTMKLDMMRIAYRVPNDLNSSLYVADCLKGKVLYHPSEVFTYEDDGRQWEAWEDDDERLADL